MIVQAAVDGGGEDGNVWVLRLKHGEAVKAGRGEQADEAELGYSGLA